MSHDTRSNSDCATMRRWIQESLDGTLGVDDERRLREHAADCAECRAARAQASALAESLAGWERLRAPSGFSSRVLAAIERAKPPVAALPVRASLVFSTLAALFTAILLAPVSRQWIGEVVVAGTERGASESIEFARVFGALVAGVAPLLTEVRAAALSMSAPVWAVTKALALAVMRLGAEQQMLVVVVLAVAMALALLRLLSPSRERRGFHVLCV